MTSIAFRKHPSCDLKALPDLTLPPNSAALSALTPSRQPSLLVPASLRPRSGILGLGFSFPPHFLLHLANSPPPSSLGLNAFSRGLSGTHPTSSLDEVPLLFTSKHHVPGLSSFITTVSSLWHVFSVTPLTGHQSRPESSVQLPQEPQASTQSPSAPPSSGNPARLWLEAKKHQTSRPVAIQR